MRKPSKLPDPPRHDWHQETLELASIEQLQSLQMRVDGLQSSHVRQLVSAINRGDPIPPVTVANIGKAFVLIDGWHRCEAYRQTGSQTVEATVASMSAHDAEAYAMTANVTHGLNLKPKDKQRIWACYVARGRHLGPDGRARSLRSIEKDLGGMYAYTTVRNHLIKMGVPLESLDQQVFDDRKPYDPFNQEELEYEIMSTALYSISRLKESYSSLSSPQDRAHILKELRTALATVEQLAVTDGAAEMLEKGLILDL